MLAQENNYLKTAYEKLEEISADQEKRLEYTARQKALYDYNTYMEENYERGVAEGILLILVDLVKKGIITLVQAASQADMTVDEFRDKTGLTV